MRPILLTRGRELNAPDQARFAAAGYPTIELPLTGIRILRENLVNAPQLTSSEWLLFTSQAPVKATLAQFKPAQSPKIAVIGPKTAAAVAAAGYQVSFVGQESKVALVRDFQQQFPQAGRIFYPKSQLADDYIETHLANVTSVIAYENYLPPASLAQLPQLLQQPLAGIYLTSPSAWQRIKPFVTTQPLLAIGPTTQQAIAAAGFSSQLVTEFLATS